MGGTDEYFHPNVADVSQPAVNFWVEASKYAANYIFNTTDTSILRYSYYLWGEWGETSNPTWAHEGVDLQYTPNNSRSVRSLSPGVVKYVNRTSGYLNVYDSILNITYNYQHLTNIPSSFVSGTSISVGQSIGNQSTVEAHVHVQVSSGSTTSVYSGRDLVLNCVNPYTAFVYHH